MLETMQIGLAIVIGGIGLSLVVHLRIIRARINGSSLEALTRPGGAQ